MILDMNMLSILVADLNKELHYKIGETKPLAGKPEDYDFLIYVSNGEHITIKFMGIEIWSSQAAIQFENPTPEEQMSWGERENFEPHLRQLIQDELNALERVTML